MPHVLDNLALLKGCMRKRPFESKEAAESLNPEDFRVYLCPFCNKWHRSSKPHLKQKLIARKKRDKQYRKAKALKRKEFFKQYEP
jgi:hypothetical protein